MRRFASLLVGMALIAGCSTTPSGAPATPTTAPATPTTAPATLATAPTAPTASAIALGGPGLAMAGPIGLMLPAGWNSRTTLPNPSGNWTLLFAGPGALPSECQGDANGNTACSSWPLVQLAPDGLIVAVRSYGNPLSKPPVGGAPITVSGIAARRISGAADGSCRAIDGTQMVEVWLPALVGQNAWYSIDACMSGTDGTAANAFAAILASTVVTAPAQPS